MFEKVIFKRNGGFQGVDEGVFRNREQGEEGRFIYVVWNLDLNIDYKF